MKILWIYKYSSSYNFDKWFHLEYVRWMKNHGIDIVAYGPEIHIGYPDICCFAYDPNLSWKSILQKTKADVAILNTKSRMFDYYSPHTKTAKGCILPNDFASSKDIPKIMIEEDYHYETDDNWYHDVGIDLILQRHHSQFLRKGKVKNMWFPFSVDISIFKPSGIQRKNRLCFVGHDTSAYPERKAICSILKNTNTADWFNGQQKINDNYVRCLQEYVAHLSTSSMYNITAAKNFEIMSSGSLLVTDRFSGIDELFPADCYCAIDKNGKDIMQKLHKILTQPEYVRQKVQNGLACIKEKHSNEIRTEQLINIIKELS